jgi:hypothetical protein
MKENSLNVRYAAIAASSKYTGSDYLAIGRMSWYARTAALSA